MGTFDTTKGKDLDFYEQKSSIMAQDYFDMLADRVLNQHCFFREEATTHNAWDDVVPYIHRLITHPRPALYVSAIKNELRAKYKSSVRGRDREYAILDFPMYNLIAFKMYVVLRYRFARNKMWMEQVLPSLYEMADMLNRSNLFYRRQTTLHTIFPSLLHYEEAEMLNKPAPQTKPDAQTETAPALRVKGNHKTDLIKVLYAVAGQEWLERADGEKATIEDIMSFFGRNLDDEGISNYSPSFGKAKNGTLKAFMKPFTHMEDFMREHYNEHNS